MRNGPKAVAEYALAFTVLLGAWWYASGPYGVPQYLLPHPQTVTATLWTMLKEGILIPQLLFTVQNIFLGLVIGTACGVLCAYAFYKSPTLTLIFEGPLVVLQTAPKIALAPLIIIWFGLGLTAKLVLVFSLVFFPVFAGALSGFRSIDCRLHDIAKLLNLSPVQRFVRIDLPASLPGVFVGIKIGSVQALVGAILAEWMSGVQGLGYLMTYASATYRTPMLFGAVLVTALLGIALHVLLNAIEARLLSWDTPDEH